MDPPPTRPFLTKNGWVGWGLLSKAVRRAEKAGYTAGHSKELPFHADIGWIHSTFHLDLARARYKAGHSKWLPFQADIGWNRSTFQLDPARACYNAGHSKRLSFQADIGWYHSTFQLDPARAGYNAGHSNSPPGCQADVSHNG